jgi:hypothetical protein
MRLLSLCFALFACTNNGTADDSASCADLAGRWMTSGTCGDDVCQISQTGCAITAVSCDSGAHSTSGSVDNGNFSYTGVSGTGVPSTCNGGLSGDTISGTCNVNGVGSCTFTGHQ